MNDLMSLFVGSWASLTIEMAGVIKMLNSNIISVTSGLIEARKTTDFWKFLYRFVYVSTNVVFILLSLDRLHALGGI